MMSTVIGGAMLPHAPQFFTMPDTEDKANVERVREVAAEIGDKLKALKPDLWIIFSNDHAEQFFHNAAPPFTIHVGGEATGEFAGRKFHWKIPSEIGFELVRQLYRQNFDPAFTSTAKIDYAIGIPLTHIGLTDPVLPIYVNAYLPPQPTMERCYAFGQAIARTVTALGLEDRHPVERRHVAFPRHRPLFQSRSSTGTTRVLEKLAAGNLKSLIGYDEAELDDTGNIELRCWACAAGALGERKPDIVSMDPSWHHNYASLGLDRRRARDEHDAHYPSIKPELVELTAALHGSRPRRGRARAVHRRCRRLCRQVQAAARPARRADRARRACDREDGRASAGAVPGATCRSSGCGRKSRRCRAVAMRERHAAVVDSTCPEA